MRGRRMLRASIVGSASISSRSRCRIEASAKRARRSSGVLPMISNHVSMLLNVVVPELMLKIL